MRTRWSQAEQRKVTSPLIDAFLDEIETVCRKHGLSISHEDHHGAFEITLFDEAKVDWLKDASDARLA